MNFKKQIFSFKVFYLLKNKKQFNDLKEIDSISKTELNIINFNKRKAIVNYAYKNIPFYKEFYDNNGFNPDDLKHEKDWSKVPLITKATLKENTKRLINPKIPSSKMRASTTGGSTGVPLKVYFDKNVPLELYGWRTLNWWGIKPWENQAYVFRNVRKGIGKVINTVKWWPTKRTLLDCSSMDKKDMDDFISEINKIKPAFIQGYVGGVYDLAKYIHENNIAIHQPKAIWVTAAPLTESTRNFIEKSLKAPVFDQYGCSEVFWLAAECQNKNGLHVLSDVRHLEFVDEDNAITEKGDLGDVTITDLENKAFPIIRYKNGDKGKYLNYSCTCGLPYPIIDKIKGRTTDNVFTPSGITINGEYLTTIFDGNPDIVDSFQIIQKSDYSIIINCVLPKTTDDNTLEFEKIKKDLQLKTKNEVNIQFYFLDKLVQDRGKLKFVISELNKT